jgi:membrane protein DedA with SNARE-associated domain
MKWPERFFKRHGDKTVFIARFIFLFPPVVVNLLAGMAKMPWRNFLFYNLTGSAGYTTTYILIGYFFGKEWKWLVARLGSTTLCLILAGLALIVLGVIYRKSLSVLLARFGKRRRK